MAGDELDVGANPLVRCKSTLVGRDQGGTLSGSRRRDERVVRRTPDDSRDRQSPEQKPLSAWRQSDPAVGEPVVQEEENLMRMHAVRVGHAGER